jgi:hypothetical protein
VKALLAEMVYLRNAGWHGRGRQRERPHAAHAGTHGSWRGCDRSDIRPGAGAPRPCAAPAERTSVSKAGKIRTQSRERTNLMATVCELSRFVPSSARAPSQRTARMGAAIHAPSKMTPKEPSPILRPTR